MLQRVGDIRLDNHFCTRVGPVQERRVAGPRCDLGLIEAPARSFVRVTVLRPVCLRPISKPRHANISRVDTNFRTGSVPCATQKVFVWNGAMTISNKDFGVPASWIPKSMGCWIREQVVLLLTVLLVLVFAPLRAEAAEQTGDCEEADNLLLDTTFELSGEAGRVWRYSQHTGERSFVYSAEDGELELARISGQPWMILKQRLSDSELSGARIRFSAELKGDLPAEPKIHAFEHKAGMYLRVGRGRAELAEHDHNVGAFDWQEVELDRVLPSGANRLEVGFVHQAGGTLWARNPKLVIVTCEGN